MDDIKDTWQIDGARSRQKRNRRRDIVTMHLIDAVIADDGRSIYHTASLKRSARAVNSCQAQDNAIAVEDDFLGLAQNLCVFRSGFGWTVFGDGTSVALRINAGAASKDESRAWETSNESGCAVAIDMAMRIRA